MASKKQAITCNTSPLLYLGRIGQVRLLSALFEPIYVPEDVILELDAGRLLRSDTINPRQFAWATPVLVSQSEVDNLPPNRLGRGERAVIAYAHSHSCLVGLDDLQARRLAEKLDLKVIGILGIIVRAKRRGLIPSARLLVDALQTQGFRLSADFYREALRLANENV